MARLEPEKEQLFCNQKLLLTRENVEYAGKAFNTKYGVDSAAYLDTVKR